MQCHYHVDTVMNILDNSNHNQIGIKMPVLHNLSSCLLLALLVQRYLCHVTQGGDFIVGLCFQKHLNMISHINTYFTRLERLSVTAHPSCFCSTSIFWLALILVPWCQWDKWLSVYTASCIPLVSFVHCHFHSLLFCHLSMNYWLVENVSHKVQSMFC